MNRVRTISRGNQERLFIQFIVANLCDLCIKKKLLTEYFPHRIQLIYDSTPRDLTYLYLSVLLSLFSFSTLDICSWKVKRFVLINILPSAVYFWWERYPFYEQLKRRESSKESTWRIQCFSIHTWSIKSFANRAKFYEYLVILYLDNKL